MALASLPMYDLPEVRPAQDAFWARIARGLRRAGVAEAPAALVYDRPPAEFWAAPDLLLSQCCGADLMGAQAGTLRVVATPCYRAPGCAGARYSSVVVVSQGPAARRLEDLRGAVCAINAEHSHSGMNALRALVAPLSHDGRFFGRVAVSGGHVASLALVARGEADVAAIDSVTHALLARHRPAALVGTRALGRTAAAPAPPFVTRADASDALVEILRMALHAACANPELAAARADLLLDGIAVLPPAAYLRLKAFERLAARYGYPVLTEC